MKEIHPIYYTVVGLPVVGLLATACTTGPNLTATECAQSSSSYYLQYGPHSWEFVNSSNGVTETLQLAYRVKADVPAPNLHPCAYEINKDKWWVVEYVDGNKGTNTNGTITFHPAEGQEETPTDQ